MDSKPRISLAKSEDYHSNVNAGSKDKLEV